ncbi:unnamed protein product [Adineta ricciae]|uniref:ubiquitinyl hydrolase 1 n=1 Tax=Adineta ricciae TaxID=249248 RepID=A0A813WNQ5_ADIRI|nr:unnamed protein product [Adineta ricciae]
MVQHCINAASADFGSYNMTKQRDAVDVVGSKSPIINTNSLHQHIRTLGSMQSGSVDFVSNVLPLSTKHYSSDMSSAYKRNTTTSSSSSSGYESTFSQSSKPHRSFFSRLKRLMNLSSTKKSSDYQMSPNVNEQHLNYSNPPTASYETRRNSLTRSDIRRKSTRRTLPSTVQHTPFLYGLKNCGNTCFINAIVQCLCHTEQLALYILRKGYEIDMRNIKNAMVEHHHSLSSSSQSHGFKVTKAFVQIFQALWNNSSNTTSKLSYDFKSIIGNLNRQYSGNDQNDAQEFLLFLINSIHDELNLAINGRQRPQSTKNSFSSVTISSQTSSSLASAELARRAWSDYTDANQSIITSTFSAQLHSTLRCNQCKQESKTFEPYLLLSLPIPQKIIKSVFVTVVFLNQSPKQLQIGLCLPVTNTVKDVREAIAQQSNLDPSDLVLAEIQQHNGFSQVFHDTESMSRLSQDVYAIQFPSSRTASSEHIASPTEPSNQVISSESSNSFVNLLVLNRVQLDSGRFERFGAPIAVRVPRESNYRALQLSIIKAQRSLILDEAMEYAQEFVVFQLSLIDQYQSTNKGIVKQEYPILHDVQWPLYLEKIVEILDTYDGPGLGPPHVQVYADWHEKYLGQFISKWGCNDDKPDVHQSVAQARAALQQPAAAISLADCFSLFTQSESLNHDDAWMCTSCRRKENGTVKNLRISTLPSVLIIHLKRFCQTKASNSKLVYPVQFPLVDLDVRRYLSTKRNDEHMNNDDSGTSDNHQDDFDQHEEKQYGLYDLYAVCNHRGSMSNGHYTAYCKNPVTEKWFCYDDHLVSELDPVRVCTPDAYILFYRRRRDSPASPASSATTSESTYKSPTSPTKQQQSIDLLTNDFDEQLRLNYSSAPQSSTIEENYVWSAAKDKPHHYVLQPPLPTPRKILTPLPPQSGDEFPLVQPLPCPAPRTRRPQYELESATYSPQRTMSPSSLSRWQTPTPNINYVYPISSTPASYIIEPLNDFYSSNLRYSNDTERLNPWNRYNNSRYSDDEQERNVIYSKSVLY